MIYAAEAALTMCGEPVEDRRRSPSSITQREIRAICCVVMLLLTSFFLAVVDAKHHRPSRSKLPPSPSESNTTTPAPPTPEAPSPQSSANGPSEAPTPTLAAPVPSSEDPASVNVAKDMHAFRKYRTVAAGLDSVQRSLLLPDMTLFAPNDDALNGVHLTGQSALALLKFHVVTTRLNFSELLNLKVGSRLSTSLTNISVVITDNSAGHFKVDNALVINPDMFVDKHVAVHGVDSVFDAASYNTLQSLGPSPNDNVSVDGPIPLQTVPSPYLGFSPPAPPAPPGLPPEPLLEHPVPLFPFPRSPFCNCDPSDSGLMLPSESPPRLHKATFDTLIGPVITAATVFLGCRLW